MKRWIIDNIIDCLAEHNKIFKLMSERIDLLQNRVTELEKKA